MVSNKAFGWPVGLGIKPVCFGKVGYIFTNADTFESELLYFPGTKLLILDSLELIINT